MGGVDEEEEVGGRETAGSGGDGGGGGWGGSLIRSHMITCQRDETQQTCCTRKSEN